MPPQRLERLGRVTDRGQGKQLKPEEPGRKRQKEGQQLKGFSGKKSHETGSKWVRQEGSGGVAGGGSLGVTGDTTPNRGDHRHPLPKRGVGPLEDGLRGKPRPLLHLYLLPVQVWVPPSFMGQTMVC